MAQVFDRRANTLSRLSVYGAVFFVEALLLLVPVIDRSSFNTGVGRAPEQPVPYQHALHVGQLGLDCRFCHHTVEVSSFASVPATSTCMICHSQIKLDSEALEPVRASLENDEPLRWTRVYDLPDFVFFDHAMHVSRGVGCETCHGRIDRMERTRQESSLRMDWCLGCHREPERFVRPREEVFTMGYRPTRPQSEIGEELVHRYGIQSLEDCSTCHL